MEITYRIMLSLRILFQILTYVQYIKIIFEICDKKYYNLNLNN